MNYKCGNAFYFRKLNQIGGVESYFYYMVRKYNKYDTIIFYREGDPEQVKRIKKYAPCIKLLKHDHIVCDKIFVNYVRDVLDQCEAKECIYVIHADYKDMVERGQFPKTGLPVDKRVDRYVGVSQLVCDSWKELTGIEAENLYEPIILDKGPKPLMFISATRLTKEKGWDRMVKLAKYLDKNGIKYTWLVYTKLEKKLTLPSKNMIFCEPRLDVMDYVRNFDAYIQLSDNEGFCLSVAEALMMGVPVICTDLPVFKELGLNDGNSIRLDMDLKDIPIDKIKNIRKLRFNYLPPEDKWDDILSHRESTYDPNKKIRVRATDAYTRRNMIDSELHIIPEEGREFEVGPDRYLFLTGGNKYKEKFVEPVKSVGDSDTMTNS